MGETRRHLGLALAGLLACAVTALASPAVELQKTVYSGYSAGAGCPGVEETAGTSGAPVTYCFAIKNIGSTYLSSITLTDGGIGITRADTTVLSGSEPLAPGDTLTLYFEDTILIDILNTASTTANPTDAAGVDLPGLPNVTDNDTARVNLVNPSVALQKTVYAGHSFGTGCQGVESVTGPIGAAITYCFLVQNTGDTHLASLAIADPDLGITQAQMTRLVGSEPVPAGGQVLYYYETTIGVDLLNTATVTANPVGPGGADLVGAADVSDDDTATVNEFTPTTTSVTTTTSTSTTTTTIQVCECDEIPFMAATTAKLAAGTSVNASFGINSPAGFLKLGPGVTMADDTTIYADRIKLGDGASVYDVATNLLLTAPTTEIRGTPSPATFPLVTPYCSLPEPVCGTSVVSVVGPGTELTLLAADYGDVTVGNGALLRLTDPGTYRFCSLKLFGAAQILATHQVTIDVQWTVNVGSYSSISTVSGAPLVLNVGGPSLRIGREAHVDAAITAPFARTKVQQSAILRGCACAASLKTAPNANLICHGG